MMTKRTSAPKATSPGVVFRCEAGQIRAKVTKRADLFGGRLINQRRNASDRERARRVGAAIVGLPVVVEIVGVIEVASQALADKLETTLRRTFCQPGSGNTYTAGQVAKVLTYCRKQGMLVHGMKNDPLPRLKSTKPVIEVRTVPDPTMPRETVIEKIQQVEDDELLAQRDHLASRRRRGQEPGGDAHDRLPQAQPGYQYAGINMSEAIGGFARVSGRTDAQTEAAKTFRQLADQAQLGGARAVDYSAAKVDTSAQSANSVAETGADARARYHTARKKLGLDTRRLIVFELLVVEGSTVSATARRVGMGDTGKARKSVSTIALDAASVLAMHFGFLAGGRRSTRFEGETPRDASLPYERAG
jgi:hypothetical protein